MLWPEYEPKESLHLRMVAPGGVHLDTIRNMDGQLQRNWAEMTAVLQLQPGDLLALSRRCSNRTLIGMLQCMFADVRTPTPAGG